MHITRGVPQESILDPILFLLYVNDVGNISSVVFIILFADDTNVFVLAKNLDHFIHVMNDEICKSAEWMSIRKLLLNVKKTKFNIFSSRKESISSICVTLNGENFTFTLPYFCVSSLIRNDAGLIMYKNM